MKILPLLYDELPFNCQIFVSKSKHYFSEKHNMQYLITQNDRNLRIAKIPILPLLQLVSTDNTNTLWKEV